jgi:hypothetical protein
MTQKPFIFTGAGNNFVVFDGREGGMEPYRQKECIEALCREHKTDGLMILGLGSDVDFTMEFYNPDGSGGMMCGNGGRCIVAFAHYLGLSPAAEDGTWRFLADNGVAANQVNKVAQGRPHIVDRIKDGGIDLIFNTTEGWQSLKDSQPIRASAVNGRIPYFTTASASIEAASE